MKILMLFILFSSFFLNMDAASRGYGQSIRCAHSSVKIQFPFWVKYHHSRNSVHANFELICKNTGTIMQFPSYGDLVVKSISYSSKKLSLLDPKNCVHEVFLNLNLSLTPFDYYYAVKNYTYLNCSDSPSSSFMPVPCLSGNGYYVYTVESSVAVPSSCRIIRTVAVPFRYNPYMYDSSFGLGLTWSISESEGFAYSAHIKAASFFSLMVAMLIVSMKIYYSKKLDEQQDEESQVEREELLGKVHIDS